MKSICQKSMVLVLAAILCLFSPGLLPLAQVFGEEDHFQVSVYEAGIDGLPLYFDKGGETGTYGNIPEDTLLEIDEQEDGWGHTDYYGYSGWIELQHTKIAGDYTAAAPDSGMIEPASYIVESSDWDPLQLRTGPGDEFSTFGPVDNDSVFTVEAFQEDWAYGSSNGVYGWLKARALTPAVAAQSGPDGEEQYAAAYEAYYYILQEHYDELIAYHLLDNNDQLNSIVFCDITGDETPELLYVAIDRYPEWAADHPGYTPVDTMCGYCLHIVTYENGQSRELYSGTIDKGLAVGGYMRYYLFQMDGEKTLYEYFDGGDDGGTESYSRYIPGNAGLEKERLCHHTEQYIGGPNEYYIEERETDAASFDNYVRDIQNRTASVLMYSTNWIVSFAQTFTEQNGSTAMTPDAALSFLAQYASAEESFDDIWDAPAVSEDLPAEEIAAHDPISIPEAEVQDAAAAELDDSAIASLKEFLQNHTLHVYDYRNPVGSSVFVDRSDFAGTYADAIYPGENGGWYEGDDPLHQFPSGRKVEVDRTNWILKYIYHCTDEDIAIMWDDVISNYGWYIYEGYLYRGGDDIARFTDVSLQELKYDGNYYYATYKKYSGVRYQGFGPVNYAVLGYETIDGEKYWTLYYSSEEGKGDLWNESAEQIDLKTTSLEFRVQVSGQENEINFRDGSTTTSSVIATIPNGTELLITDLVYNAQDDLFFGYTEYNGIPGWVSIRQTILQSTPSFQVQVNSQETSINFRGGSSTESNIIGQIPNGTILYITNLFYNYGNDLLFGYTTFNGMSGYVSLRQTNILK